MEKQKFLVLDTNIVLLDANNLLTVGDKDTIVVLPETTVDELDSKKSAPGELGYQAREFGRILAKATKVSTDKLDHLVVSNFEYEGTTVALVSSDKYPDYTDVSPSIINDRKIIFIAECLSNQLGLDTTFMSNDVMARVRAETLGLSTTDLKVVKDVDFIYHRTLPVSSEQFANLHRKPILEIDPDYLPQYYSYRFIDENTGQIKLSTITNGSIDIIGKETEKELRRQDINPMNAEQLIFSHSLQDPTIDLVVCEALAGSGKTAVAISNGIRMVRQGHYDGILYIRASVNDVDENEEVGFLPGFDEKFAVYLHPLEDTLDFVIRQRHKNSKLKGDELEQKIVTEVEDLRTKCNIQAMTTLGMRGRTFSNMYIIIDEVQNQSQSSLQKTLTRVGKGSKVICIGSLKQIDNKYINKYTSGLSILLNDVTHENDYIKTFAVNLQKVVRSPMAEYSERLFSKES